MKNFFKKKNKGFTRTPKFGVTPKGGGFTLIETLVAISIFSMSILGLLVILSKGISDLSYTKKKIVAGYLAQEGIEYIRNMRDTFVLYEVDSQTGWNNFDLYITRAGVSCQASNGCYFNSDNVFSITPPMPMSKITLSACGTSCSPLLFDIATGTYGYNTSGTDSGFIRKIKVTPVGTPVDEIKISSTVYWTQGSGSYSTVFTEDLYNWME